MSLRRGDTPIGARLRTLRDEQENTYLVPGEGNVAGRRTRDISADVCWIVGARIRLRTGKAVLRPPCHGCRPLWWNHTLEGSEGGPGAVGCCSPGVAQFV